MPIGMIVLLLCCLAQALLSGLLFVSILRVIEHYRKLDGRPLPLDIRIESLAPASITAIASAALILTLLFWRRRTGINIAVALFWFVFALIPAAIVLHSVLSGAFSRIGSMALLWFLAGEIVLALLATFYLLRSRRVAEFYSPDAKFEGVFD